MCEGDGLHLADPVLLGEAPLGRAGQALILVHGRGETSRDILTLVGGLQAPDFADAARLAPNDTWHFLPFSTPIAGTNPYLSSSLTLLGEIDRNFSGLLAEMPVFLGSGNVDPHNSKQRVECVRALASTFQLS